MRGPEENYLEQLLDEYREGRVESSGHFTYNPARALELMQRYQFETAELYILPLVQFAVQGKASEIRVSVNQRQLDFACDADPPRRETVENLPSYLLGDSSPLKSLALAVCNARNLDLEQMQLVCPRFEADLLSDLPTVKKAKSDSRHPCLIRVVKRKQGLFGSRQPAFSKESRYLTSGCRYSLVPVQLNDRPVSHPVRWKKTLVFRQLRHKELPLAAEAPTQGEAFIKDSTGPFAAVIGLGLAGESKVAVVENGVVTRLSVDWRSFRAVVRCPTLKRDLTGLRVVRDEEWRRLLRALWAEYVDMLVQLFYYRERLSEDLWWPVLPLVETLMDINCRDGHYQTASFIGSWLREVWERFSSTSPLEHSIFLYKYSLILRKLSKVRVADQFQNLSQSILNRVRSELTHHHYTLPSGHSLKGERYAIWLQCLADENVYGAGHPSVMERLTMQGLRAEQSERFEEAELYYQRLVNLRAAELGPDHPELIRREGSLGRVYLARGRFQEAAALLARAVELYERLEEEDPRLLYDLLSQLAQAEAATGLLQRAQKTLQRILDFRPGDPAIQKALNRLKGTTS